MNFTNTTTILSTILNPKCFFFKYKQKYGSTIIISIGGFSGASTVLHETSEAALSFESG